MIKRRKIVLTWLAIGAILLLPTPLEGGRSTSPFFRYHSSESPSRPQSPSYATFLIQDSSTVDQLLSYAFQYIGTPYRYGGQTPKGFDCAGFVRFVYRQFGFDLGSSCSPQYRAGTDIRHTTDLRRGDLVFFGDRHKVNILGHVGIVTHVDPQSGKFRFIHSSTSAGVIESRSSEPYYVLRYLCACRILSDADMLPRPPLQPEPPATRPWHWPNTSNQGTPNE